MADAGLTLVVVPPGFGGLFKAVQSLIRDDSILTAYEDSRLRLFSTIQGGEDEVEIVPFAELLNQVLRMMGLSTARIPTRGQRHAMTALACQALPSSTAMERAAKYPGMSRLISDELDMLRHYGLGTAELRLVAQNAPEATALKLETLAEIIGLTMDSMDATKREFLTDRIDNCLEGTLPVSPLKHVIALVGPNENPWYDRWLNWLALQGVEVHALVELIPERPDLFIPAQKAASRLNAKKRIVFGDVSWCDQLFTENKGKSHPEVEIISCCDPLSESEWVLRKCHELIKSGVAPEKIGLFARDQKRYVPRLTAASQVFNIKLDSLRAVPLMSCGLSVTTLKLLKAIDSPDIRHLAKLTKSSYCPTPVAMQNTIWEVVAQLTREGGDKWSKFQLWSQETPDCPMWLKHVLRWKDEKSTGSVSLSSWLDRFREFIGDVVIHGASENLFRDTQQRDLRAQTVLQRAIADRSFVYDQAGLGDLSYSNFISLAESLWEEETVIIGGNQEGIKFLSDVGALGDLEVFFVLGMLEGTMPRRRRENPLLTDEELKLIGDSLGIDIPDSHSIVLEERDHFYRLCLGGTNRLYFSYPLANEEHDNVPAFYLEELERCLERGLKKVVHGRDEVVPFAEECDLEADRNLRAILDGQETRSLRFHLSETYAKELVMPNYGAGITIDEISRVLACPFQAAFKDRLQLQAPFRKIGMSSLIGIPRRSSLALAPSREEAISRMKSELEQIIEFRLPMLEDWEVELLRTTGERLCIEWAEREFQSRSLWPREPGSVFTDVPFGEKSIRNNLVLLGKPVVITGTIPAIYNIGETSVIQVFWTYHPKFNASTEEMAVNSAMFEVGFMLYLLFSRSLTSVAVDVDSLGGARNRVIKTPSRALAAPKGSYTNIHWIKESVEDISYTVKQRAKEAIRLLDTGLAMAIPGEYCSRCFFAEICRATEEGGFE